MCVSRTQAAPKRTAVTSAHSAGKARPRQTDRSPTLNPTPNARGTEARRPPSIRGRCCSGLRGSQVPPPAWRRLSQQPSRSAFEGSSPVTRDAASAHAQTRSPGWEFPPTSWAHVKQVFETIARSLLGQKGSESEQTRGGGHLPLPSSLDTRTTGG